MGTLPGAASEVGAEETVHPAGSPGGHHPYHPFSPPASVTWRRSASSTSLASASTAPSSPACWNRQPPAAGHAEAPAGAWPGGAAAGPAACAEEEAANSLEAALQLAALSDEHLDVLGGGQEAAAAGAGLPAGPAAQAGGGGAAADEAPFSADAVMQALGLPPHLRARCCGTAFHDQELFLSQMSDDHLKLARYQQSYHRREMYQCLQLLAERTQGPFVELICGSADDDAAGGAAGEGGAGASTGGQADLRLSPIPVFWLARSALDRSRVLGLCSAVVWS